MKSKTSLKKILFIIGMVELLFSSMIILFLTFDISVQGSSYTKPVLPTIPAKSIHAGLSTGQVSLPVNHVVVSKLSIGLPIRLAIPSIKVDAPIKSLGLTPQGAMDTTKGPYDVAWYNLGPRPGEKGSAVIAGHYGIWKNGAISVFHDLNKLRKGDKLSIKDDKGTIITFVVRESKTYYPNADASDVFYSSDGKSHLNLVTCIYDTVSRTYPKRLVVFTDKE